MERIKKSVTRGKAVSITLDGKRIKAYENEIVGMSIFAAGKRTLARSLKYHRPRSMFCSTGTCHRCLMEIDGIPNRRACLTLVKDGMVIRSQNSFPNAEKDLLSFIDKFSNYLQTSIFKKIYGTRTTGSSSACFNNTRKQNSATIEEAKI